MWESKDTLWDISPPKGEFVGSYFLNWELGTCDQTGKGIHGEFEREYLKVYVAGNVRTHCPDRYRAHHATLLQSCIADLQNYSDL